MNEFKTILIDPPWKYGTWGSGSDKCVCHNKKCNEPKRIPYNTLTVDEIKSIQIKTLASENCEVYLWTTQKYLPHAFDCFNAWEIKYCTTLTWCKEPMGLGQGGVYCPTTEFILHGRYGKFPVDIKRINTTWFKFKRTGIHSKKPEEFQDIIETVSYPPRIELFARRKRQGWVSWGNEVSSDIIFWDARDEIAHS